MSLALDVIGSTPVLKIALPSSPLPEMVGQCVVSGLEVNSSDRWRRNLPRTKPATNGESVVGIRPHYVGVGYRNGDRREVTAVGVR